MRPFITVATAVALLAQSAGAQRADSSAVSKTFLDGHDLVLAGTALAGAALVSYFDPAIARASQGSRFQDSSLHNLSLTISHVNETTLTIAGIATYGIARLANAPTVTDVALHATESVVLASVVSQLIRGPLGRTRPYVSHDSNQYKFKPFRGFVGDSTFDYRAFPSIHTSSSMAVATVLAMEMQRREVDGVGYIAPMLYAAGMLPGLARIQLDQHWASDVVAGAFLGVFTARKVVSYSHDHPDNWFDRTLQNVSVMPDANGRVSVAFSPSF